MAFPRFVIEILLLLFGVVLPLMLALGLVVLCWKMWKIKKSDVGLYVKKVQARHDVEEYLSSDEHENFNNEVNQRAKSPELIQSQKLTSLLEDLTSELSDQKSNIEETHEVLQKSAVMTRYIQIETRPSQQELLYPDSSSSLGSKPFSSAAKDHSKSPENLSATSGALSCS